MKRLAAHAVGNALDRRKLHQPRANAVRLILGQPTFHLRRILMVGLEGDHLDDFQAQPGGALQGEDHHVELGVSLNPNFRAVSEPEHCRTQVMLL
jgi:hypothetical protein